MPEQLDTEHWPLKRLNAVAIPVAVFLAIYAASFWSGLIYSASVSALVAFMLGVGYLASYARRLDRMKIESPLRHIDYSLKFLQVPKARFVAVQTASGALIGSMWFGIA